MVYVPVIPLSLLCRTYTSTCGVCACYSLILLGVKIVTEITNNRTTTNTTTTTTTIIIIITQGVSLSLRRNPSLHALHNFLSFTMGLQVGPTYQIKLSHNLVLGRPRGLLCPRGIHSVTDCPSIVTSPRHVTPPICVCFLLSS